MIQIKHEIIRQSILLLYFTYDFSVLVLSIAGCLLNLAVLIHVAYVDSDMFCSYCQITKVNRGFKLRLGTCCDFFYFLQDSLKC